MSKLGVKDDEAIEIDQTSRNDLRIRVPRHNIFKMICWFVEGEHREYCHWREFQEELVKTGILPSEIFPYVTTKNIHRIFTNMEYSEHFKMWEIKIFDLIEPMFTNEQEVALETILNAGNNEDYIWLPSELIERAGNNPITKKDEFKLGTQTKYIL